MHKQLKSILSHDLAKGLGTDYKQKVELSKEQSTHVYKTEGKYKAEYRGYLTFSFNNETAWFWNKDIEVELNLDSGREVELLENTEIEILEKNKFLIKNLKYNANFTISLNNNEIVEWSFNVRDSNSIDFEMFFSHNYLGILDDVLDELNLMNDSTVTKNFFIKDLEKKLNDRDIIIKDNEHIVKELNTIIQDKDKAILNKDIVIQKKDVKIRTLEARVQQLENRAKTNNNNNLRVFGNIPRAGDNSHTTSSTNNTNSTFNPWANYYNTSTNTSSVPSRSHQYYVNKGKFW